LLDARDGGMAEGHGQKIAQVIGLHG